MLPFNCAFVAGTLGIEIPDAWKETVITSVFTDSRAPEPGGLFVALVGDHFNGHAYVLDAFRAGAVAAICSEPIETDLPVFYVRDTREAFLALAAGYRGLFQNIPVVGLTGSVGKTTTKEMTAQVLSAKYITAKTQGNLNNEVGMPQTILSFAENIEAAVVEMGMNHAGEISRLSKACRPTLAIITNIGTSHIGNLGSREAIMRAKLEILDGMEPGSTLILNGDNDLLGAYANDKYHIITFGIENRTADVLADAIHTVGSGTAFNILYGGDVYEAFIPVPGEHNVANALAAFTAGVQVGVDPSDAAKALAGYKPTGLRQHIEDIDGITFIEDCYNASPDSVKANLVALMSIDAKRHVAVLGDMKELGSVTEEAHYDCGVTAAAKGVDIVFGLGEASRDICRGAQEKQIPQAEHFTDAEALAARLVEVLRPGDAVLFKASRAMRLETVIERVKQLYLEA